jgi:hypothetical protein
MDFGADIGGQGGKSRATSPPVYEYDLKDHLGNNRVMFAENGDLVSTIAGYYRSC